MKRYEQKTFGNFFPPILNLTCAIHDVYIVFWVCILYVWVNGCPSQFTSTRMDQHIFVSVLQSFFAVSCFVIFLIILYLPNRFQSKRGKGLASRFFRFFLCFWRLGQRLSFTLCMMSTPHTGCPINRHNDTQILSTVLFWSVNGRDIFWVLRMNWLLLEQNIILSKLILRIDIFSSVLIS